MEHRKKYRTAISVILSFFLTVCLFLIMFCSEIWMGYLGTRTFHDSLTESRYIENTIDKMKSQRRGINFFLFLYSNRLFNFLSVIHIFLFFMIDMHI